MINVYLGDTITDPIDMITKVDLFEKDASMRIRDYLLSLTTNDLILLPSGKNLMDTRKLMVTRKAVSMIDGSLNIFTKEIL
jgi:hypothetical protein